MPPILVCNVSVKSVTSKNTLIYSYYQVLCDFTMSKSIHPIIGIIRFFYKYLGFLKGFFSY